MKMDNQNLSHKLLQRFDELCTQLELFCQAISADEGSPAWVSELPNYPFIPADTDRKRACQVIKRLEYFDNQEPREIILCPGLIAANTNTIETAKQLNQAKLNFKQAVLDLKAAKIKINSPELTEYFEKKLTKRDGGLNINLKKVGLSRLHLKQCYRLIPILAEKPLSVSWTWAHTKAIKKITINQAEQLLLKQGSDEPKIQMQLAKLKNLRFDEKLAIVQELAPHLRANITYPENGNNKLRQMVKGPIPILYPIAKDDNFILPKIKLPKPKQEKNSSRLIRSDTQLDSEAYLPSLRAFRYVKPLSVN